MELEGWMDGLGKVDGWSWKGGWMELEGWMDGVGRVDGWSWKGGWMFKVVRACDACCYRLALLADTAN